MLFVQDRRPWSGKRCPTHSIGDNAAGADGYVWTYQAASAALWVGSGALDYSDKLYGSGSINPPSIANGTLVAVGTIAVAGALVGDLGQVTPPFNYAGGLQGLRAWGDVTAPDTVTVYVSNNTGASIDLLGAHGGLEQVASTPLKASSHCWHMKRA